MPIFPEVLSGFKIYWDMDGVVLDSTDGHHGAWQQALGDLGGSITREEYIPLIGLSTAETARLLHQRQDLERSWLHLAVAKEIIYRREQFKAGVFDDSLRLMETLAGFGITQALATSETIENIEVIYAKRLHRYFNTVVTSSDVRRRKPAPDVYQEAMRRLWAVPRFCIAVEDTPRGIESAKAAGMLCLAVTNTVEPGELQAADHITDNITLDDLVATVTNAA
jgi:beta-phosphoglucomutase-like phosphatase (HAD superfamily)